MLQFFLNPWLLAGLTGISLPIIAHLLSRRRFDVVEWAAMQFLNPARRTRRRLRLEELLLLMIRIGMISLLALAAARPWIPGGWLSGFRSAGSRAIVLIIDSSNSMSRTDGLNSLHQSALRRASEILTALGPGDQVALIDARDQPRVLIDSPVQDQRVIADALAQLPPPAGAANLPAALQRAIAILGRSSSAAREVIVLSDRQRASWKVDSDIHWKRLDDLRSFPAVKPQFWIVDVADHLTPVRHNVAIGPISLPRDLTVPDFPFPLSVSLRNSSAETVTANVRLLQNRQPLAGQQRRVEIPATGEATVQFDSTMHQIGRFLISAEVTVEGDQVPADNAAHAVVSVASAVPVLLVNGIPSPNPQERETFFAAIALTTPGNRTPWVQATVVDAADVTATKIHRSSIVLLADVANLPPTIPQELQQFVRRGNGVIICCGSNSTPESFDRLFHESGLTPAVRLVRPREAGIDAVQVAPLTLPPGWLDRFRSDPSRSFLKTRFQKWWLTSIIPPSELRAASLVPAAPERVAQSAAPTGTASSTITDNVPLQATPAADTSGKLSAGLSDTPAAQPPVVLAQLMNGDPLLIESALGEGSVLIWTSSLSRKWNDFPAKSDYVPFLHEAVFRAAASGIRRNVAVGAPLIADVTEEVNGEPAATVRDAGAPTVSTTDDKVPTQVSSGDAWFQTPSGQMVSAGIVDESGRRTTVLNDTLIPGIYHLKQNSEPESAIRDSFVVDSDHSEDDMSELDANDRMRLAADDRMQFVKSVRELHQRMYGNESRTELWAVLLFSFLTMIVCELLLTRRIVRRGHGDPMAES